MTPAVRDSRFQRFLNGVEVLGNALPHPATLFLLLCGVVIGVSGSSSWLESGVASGQGHSRSGGEFAVRRGLEPDHPRSAAQFHRLRAARFGARVRARFVRGGAQRTAAAVMRRIVQATSPRLLTLVVVFCTMSHTAGDVGYVLLLPLSAALFHSAGAIPWPDWRRHSAGFRVDSRRTCCSRPRTSFSPG